MVNPSNHPEDNLSIIVCPENSECGILCAIAIYIAESGLSCVYLTLPEVETLQKELAGAAAKMRACNAKP